MSGQEMHLNQLSSRSKAPSSHSIIIQYGATILTEFKTQKPSKTNPRVLVTKIYKDI